MNQKANTPGASAAALGSAELLPCPFCGRAAPGPKSGVHMIANQNGHSVRCPTCNTHGPACPTFEQACEQWNRRAPRADTFCKLVGADVSENTITLEHNPRGLVIGQTVWVTFEKPNVSDHRGLHLGSTANHSTAAVHRLVGALFFLYAIRSTFATSLG